MEDGDAEDDDVKGEEASMLILRRRKRMILRRNTKNPHFVRALAVEMHIHMSKQILEEPFDT